MDGHELKAECLALPGVREEFPFGDEVSVFKVGAKMFAICSLDAEPLQLSVKCEPELAVGLRAAYPSIAPGYHLNKRHWNTITLDGSLPDQMVTGFLRDSYDLVVASLPKAHRPVLTLLSRHIVGAAAGSAGADSFARVCSLRG